MHREFQPGLMGVGHSHDHHHEAHQEHDHDAELRALVASTFVVGALLGLDIVLGLMGSPAQSLYGVRLALAAAVIGGGRVVYLALSALLEGRIGADIALAIATIAAGLAGEYFVAAEVVFIALVGECLEAFAFHRAQRSIQKLLEYRPTLARVLRGDGQDEREVEIAAEGLVVGDRVVVRPGERIAVDGVVLAGRSAVDQAVLTGESLPADKGAGDPVYSGTMNQFGRLVVQAEKVGAATTLGQVIRLLAEAQRNKSPLERTADRYARLFLPAVLLAASIVFLGTNAGVLWKWSTEGIRPAFDVMPTLAVLVVACPCALILATPAAVLAATARLARRGVLVKGGAAIERLAKVDAFAFDKTGTLTQGQPEIGEILTLDEDALGTPEILRLAASAERGSEHPLARLLVNLAGERELALSEVVAFEAQPGAGIAASVECPGRERILVGNLRLFREHGIAIGPWGESTIQRLDESGQTALLVAVNGELAGAIGARDKVRREAHDVIHDLKHLGLKDLTILTGDRVSPAAAVAKKVHIKKFESELTPAGKAEWIRKRQEEGRIVAMVGDGVNDAPALATADVGLALGGVGADIAAEAGSIVLMGAPLDPLPEAVRVARQTVRVIRQNILLFAFGLNGIAVLLAGLRVLGPIPAAVLHQIGSLFVLLNAVRLLGFDGLASSPTVQATSRLVAYCRACRPSNGFDAAWRYRRALTRVVGLGLLVAYLTSGVTVVETGEIGLLQRFGRYLPPSLGPGLHARWPWPVETVTKLQPDQTLVARVGPSGSSGAVPVAWGTSHGGQRDESALYFTGDESLVELSGVVEYHLTEQGAAETLFGVSKIEDAVTLAAEGAFREAAGKTSLEGILATGRRGFESGVETRLRERLLLDGLKIEVDRVRVLDAHPPREVVVAYRDVSAAVSDAERFRNEAEAYSSEQHWQAIAEAQSKRDAGAARELTLKSKAKGQSDAFRALASARTSHSDLTDFRLTWDTFQTSHAGKPKILLDPKAGGRRHVWLADPSRAGIGPAILPPEVMLPPPEPED